VPYCGDALNLPVADVAAAVPYYERTFGFAVVSRGESPHARVVLARDNVQIGLAENGGDSSQDGCFFEVDDVDAAFEEMKGRGLSPGGIEEQDAGGKRHRAFFIVAPDGLCYMIAERVTPT
jgi:catechol 2,3-dioxygenase-like lactoylglutathione lyase family enzyme